MPNNHQQNQDASDNRGEQTDTDIENQFLCLVSDEVLESGGSKKNRNDQNDAAGVSSFLNDLFDFIAESYNVGIDKKKKENKL